MAKRPPLVYKDYHPIKPGDPGYTQAKKNARWYYSPSENKELNLREFQTAARGVKYPEFVKQRKKRGVRPKKYKTKKVKEREEQEQKRIRAKIKKSPKQKRQEIVTRVVEEADLRTTLINRSEYLKQSYAAGISNGELTFEELNNEDIANFWNAYHEVFYEEAKDYDYYAEFFDVDIEYFDEVEYGITP
jgi:hypothetical protein